MFLPVVHDVPGDRRSPEPSHLEKALWIVGEKSCPIEDLSSLGERSVYTQPKPVEDVADIQVGIWRYPVLLNS